MNADWYKAGKSIQEFHDSGAFVRFLIGGRGCIHGDTRIFDPEDGSNFTAKQRAEKGEDFHVLSINFSTGILEPRKASRPYLKGHCALLRVKIYGIARPLLVSPEHRFLTPSGWVQASNLAEAELVMTALDFQEPSEVTPLRLVCSAQYRQVLSIEPDQEADYYDLSVPVTENYLAEGVIHHNSGKTVGSTMEAIRHCWHNAGAKVMIVRKTETSQADTTIETLRHTFDSLGELYSKGETGLFETWRDGKTIRLPSRLAVEEYNKAKPKWQSKSEKQLWLDTEGNRLCSFIEFRGLPHATTNENKLRGFECSMMILVEADLLERNDFAMAAPCLRWKGADPEMCNERGHIVDACIIVETNPPAPDHWIAKLEEETLRGEHPNYRFWHLKTEENAHNLPIGYVDNLKEVYRNNKAMYARMVNGEYADAYTGNPVIYAFNPDIHVGEDLPWPKGAYLVRGWDFGTRNSVVWSAYWIENGIEYWHDLQEQYLEGSDTDRQAREAIKTTEAEFPFYNDREICSGLIDTCDPAGANSSYTRRIEVNGKDVAESSVNILRTYGIVPVFRTHARGLQETIATVNRLLESKDKAGRPVYRVDKKHCPILVRGYMGAYRYPDVGETGYGTNQPLKGHLCNNVDHIQDAARYAKINCLKLLQAEMEKIKKPNYQSAYRNPNPAKRLR